MNRRKIAATLLLLAAGSLFQGCSYRAERGWEFNPIESLVDGLFENAFERKSENEKLWEQGYGFNNPNADKFRREPIVVGAD